MRPAADAGVVLVTGATGFLGRHVVDAVLRAGHVVRALVRPGNDQLALPWGDHPRLQTARLDLRQRAQPTELLEGCTTVVHLAATKTGDFASRFAGTVVATENLLDAMSTAGVRRLVHCSTFSVYRSGALPHNGLLDETAPLEDRPLERDEYAQVKLVQERLVREWASAGQREHVILRPGLIYGSGALWHSLLGVEILPVFWLGAGWRTRLPIAWVENVADAFVCALGQQPLAGETVNIVDDVSPSIREYVRTVRPLVSDAPRLFVTGYPMTRALVHTLDAVNRRLLESRLRLPGGLCPVPFEARFRPLLYTNRRAREVLGWTPRLEFPATLAGLRPGHSSWRGEPGPAADTVDTRQ